MMPKTLFEKIWDAHLVRDEPGQPALLYIDLHLVHEVTSPQAFDGLRLAGRSVRRPDLTVATEDHNVPTTGVTGPDLPLRGPGSPVTDPVSQVQVEALRKNCAEFGITLHPMGDPGQVIEYRGEAVGALSMEGRMTVCNMSIEAGARAGLVAPDETTFEYLRGRPRAPRGAAWEAALDYWRTLPTDADAAFDREVTIDGSALTPFVTWGTNPGQAAPLSSAVPDPASLSGETARASAERALTYMGLEPGTRLTQISVDTGFLGSWTNGRLDDLTAADEVLRGRMVPSGVRTLVVPGSMEVKVAAEREGLAEVFTAAGAEWRSAGCSMCLGMNPDTMARGERSASTSNRNFEGRQGDGARTHLVSPQVAAATAVTGRLTSPADL